MSRKISNTIGIAYVDTKKQKETLESSRKHKKPRGCMGWLYDSVANFYLSDKKYCHCEVAFNKTNNSLNDLTCLAFGVFSDKGVFCENRTFSNPAYDWIWINVTEKQKERALKFCNAQVGKEFDYWGAHLMPLWAGSEPQGDKWWCGSFTLAVLHEAGILTSCRNGSMSIDDIIDFLQEHPNKTGRITPYNLHQLEQYYKGK